MLQSEAGILAAPKTHGKGLIPKNFTQIVASSSCYMWLKPSDKPFLAPKNNFGCMLQIRAASQKVELAGEVHRISFSHAFTLLM